MLISPAFAGHFMADDGNTGSGDTLLIILGVGLVLGLLYMGQKKWRRRMLTRQGESESREQ
jgi:LPXTG-motif cell wall-anchored protein